MINRVILRLCTKRIATVLSVIMLYAGLRSQLFAADPAEQETTLKIVARKRLQGPSQWGVPPEYRLVRTLRELDAAIGSDLADQIFREFGRPKIDFERYMLVYVSAGSQRSSGYEVHVADIKLDNAAGKPRVRVRWSLHEPSGFALTVITTPAEVVMVERGAGEAVFERVPIPRLPHQDPKVNDEQSSATVPADGDGAKSAEQSSMEQVDWNELMREYVALELPLPPNNATAAAKYYDTEVVENRNFSQQLFLSRHLLGFVVPDANPAKRSRFLVGTEFSEFDPDDESDLVKITPDQALPHFVEEYPCRAFAINVALPTAVQFYRRDLRAHADKIWRSQSRRSYGHPNSIFHQPAGLPPSRALRYVAWAYWGNQLAEGGTDRAAAYRHMRQLSQLDWNLRTTRHTALLESLAAALKPSQAAAGSGERLVDDLVEAVDGTPLSAKLAERGWEIMPILLSHLDDRRLTRSLVYPKGDAAPYLPQIGELVGNLVQEFAGDEGRGWNRTSDDHFLHPDPVRVWWKRAQSQGEEAYLVKSAVPRATGGFQAYDAVISRLARRYPQRLPDVYRRLLTERPDLSSSNIVQAIAASDLEPAVKTDTLSAAASHPRVRRRAEALEALSRLDVGLFEQLLLKSVAASPVPPSDRYAYNEQLDLVRLCWKSDRNEVWNALRDSTSKADVGMRMEIIGRLGRSTETKLSHDKQIRLTGFLGAFLDDEEVRDTTVDPQKYVDCAGYWWPQLEVRNWAAYQLAPLFAIDISDFRRNQIVTDEQWSRLRKDVAARQSEVKRADSR